MKDDVDNSGKLEELQPQQLSKLFFNIFPNGRGLLHLLAMGQ